MEAVLDTTMSYKAALWYMYVHEKVINTGKCKSDIMALSRNFINALSMWKGRKRECFPTNFMGYSIQHLIQ